MVVIVHPVLVPLSTTYAFINHMVVIVHPVLGDYGAIGTLHRLTVISFCFKG
jgi:hypothetical protein